MYVINELVKVRTPEITTEIDRRILKEGAVRCGCHLSGEVYPYGSLSSKFLSGSNIDIYLLIHHLDRHNTTIATIITQNYHETDSEWDYYPSERKSNSS